MAKRTVNESKLAGELEPIIASIPRTSFGFNTHDTRWYANNLAKYITQNGLPKDANAMGEALGAGNTSNLTKFMLERPQLVQERYDVSSSFAGTLEELSSGEQQSLLQKLKINPNDIPALTEGFITGAESSFSKLVDPDSPSAQILAAGIHTKLRDLISAQTGRSATREEIVAAFNQIPFEKEQIGKEELLANPSNVLANAISKSGILTTLKPKLDLITSLKLNLKGTGIDISPEDLSLIAGSSSLDEANVRGQDALKRARDQVVTREAAGIPGQELEAIGELEKQATERGTQFFQEQFAPQVEQLLERRGIRTSGSLAEALAQGGVSLRRNLQEQFEPLRAQSKLGGIQKSYENTLRSALESGQSLQQAISTANQMTFQRRQQEFSAGESALDRQMQQLLSQQNLATALAMQQRTQRPSSFDQFLQYGLQPLTQIVSPFIQQKAKTGSFFGG